MQVSRVLWPTDFSDSDCESLEAVAPIAQVFDAEVVALHAARSVSYKIVRTAPCNVLLVK